MQNPPRIWLNYRPVRIGWVVPDHDPAVLVTVAALSSCLWGGRFHPVIPMHDDAELSERLIEIFAVDVLIPVLNTDATRAFIERYPQLAMKRWHDNIFNQRKSEFADIRHVLRRMTAQQDKQTESKLVLPTWEEADDLLFRN